MGGSKVVGLIALFMFAVWAFVPSYRPEAKQQETVYVAVRNAYGGPVLCWVATAAEVRVGQVVLATALGEVRIPREQAFIARDPAAIAVDPARCKGGRY